MTSANSGPVCSKCGAKGADLSVRLVRHHIIPRSRNGTDDENNMEVLCTACHGKAHSALLKDPEGKRRGDRLIRLDAVVANQLDLYRLPNESANEVVDRLLTAIEEGRRSVIQLYTLWEHNRIWPDMVRR